MQARVFGQAAVRLPFQMLADEPVILRVGGQCGAQCLQQAGGHGVITVQKQQPVALRGLQAGVARGGQTAVLPVDDPQAGDLSGEGIAKLARQIGRAVIDKDALPIALPRLLRHALDTRREVILHIIHRYNNRKSRHNILLLYAFPKGEGGPAGPDEGQPCPGSPLALL